MHSTQMNSTVRSGSSDLLSRPSFTRAVHRSRACRTSGSRKGQNLLENAAYRTTVHVSATAQSNGSPAVRLDAEPRPHHADGEIADLPPNTLHEFQRKGEAALPGLSHRYFAYKVGDGVTSQRTRDIFNRIRLKPRILTGAGAAGVPNPLATTCLGAEVALPVLIAPSAFHKFACEGGEAVTAAAAGKEGALYCYNWMLAHAPYREVAAAEGPKWVHVYLARDRGLVARSLQQAAATGAFTAVVVTCDHPHARARDTMIPDFRANRDRLPEERGRERALGNISIEEFENDSGLTWADLDWLRTITDLPIVVKGVLCVEDAELAVAHGASAIIVSNHGNRQVDGAVAAIEVLPEIAAAVGDQVEVYLDGEIRTSQDIIKAVALGARAVLIGRLALWGLACGGEEGLRGLLGALRRDLEADLLSCGVASLADVGPDVLYRPPAQRTLEEYLW